MNGSNWEAARKIAIPLMVGGAVLFVLMFLAVALGLGGSWTALLAPLGGVTGGILILLMGKYQDG